MSYRTIGIVDYGVGNLASVWRALHGLGYRCRISSDRTVLDATDVLLLPGVGAFPSAMHALHQHDMVDFLQVQARLGKPVIGICLGMQLLADTSDEIQQTAGLGLIPGAVQELADPATKWHIGWNGIEVTSDDPAFKSSDGRSFYFNHSFVFHAPTEYVSGVARITQGQEAFPVAVRRNNIVGLQFHPEKSQAAGHELMGKIIEGVCHA
ncbi:imidazole glycerol phosphate synthase subunit HisH [Herbaspirillum robiniae]|uniref:Imidazole glycerol phosphate synthase subunit HisH n=1 Tax=Herbaspirillum robiniae TaxID=2014887 RepID=A0ABX2LZR8_9BURK|nr:imidazole glycerol phosphate synthase subunit HisH [Herbaspirillum robiniae]NUU03194.1 imidazole glycerol phosphate synthase subunit HisH [Herbaspirillum robiniae]